MRMPTSGNVSAGNKFKICFSHTTDNNILVLTCHRNTELCLPRHEDIQYVAMSSSNQTQFLSH
jgi:hypothetical protein